MILSFVFAKAVTAQAHPTREDVIGKYTTKHGLGTEMIITNDGTKFFWKFELLPNNRFEYHYFSQHPKFEENHRKGRGSWVLDKRTITFNTEPDDVSEEYSLNFEGSMARYFKPSPRNPKKKDDRYYLQFFTSEAEAIENLRLYKIE